MIKIIVKGSLDDFYECVAKRNIECKLVEREYFSFGISANVEDSYLPTIINWYHEEDHCPDNSYPVGTLLFWCHIADNKIKRLKSEIEKA